MVYIIRDFSFGLSSYWILLNDFRWLVIKSSFGLVKKDILTLLTHSKGEGVGGYARSSGHINFACFI